MEFLVSVEAVSFGKVMDDTDDLSAIRGASWAMMAAASGFCDALQARLGDDVSVTRRFAGASLARVVAAGDGLTADTVRAAVRDVLGGGSWTGGVRGLAEVLPFLVFATAVTENDSAVNERARAARQYRMLDTDLPVWRSTEEARENVRRDENSQRADASGAIRLIDQLQPCVKDRLRPIARLGWRSADASRGETDGKPRRDVPVSASFFARHEFGRTGRRPVFYEDQAGIPLKNTASLADSFEEIASEGQPERLPVTVRNKMAVLYMDGNAFGRLLKEWERRGGNADGFAGEMAGKRKAMLKSLVELFLDDGCADWLQLKEPGKRYLENGEERDTPVLRFETLMWGADESMLVFPGWAFPAVIRRLERILKSGCGRITMPDGAELPLTYGIGCAIGHYKTPIRAMKRLAVALADQAKKRGKLLDDGQTGASPGEMRSFAEYMILSGIDLPVRKLAAEREALYGVHGEEAQRRVFSIPLDGFGETLARFARVRGEPGGKEAGAPRAKLAGLLHDAREAGVIGMQDPNPRLLDDLKSLLASHVDSDGASLENALAPAWARQAPLAPLVHLLSLWNYIGIMPPGCGGEDAA